MTLIPAVHAVRENPRPSQATTPLVPTTSSTSSASSTSSTSSQKKPSFVVQGFSYIPTVLRKLYNHLQKVVSPSLSSFQKSVLEAEACLQGEDFKTFLEFFRPTVDPAVPAHVLRKRENMESSYRFFQSFLNEPRDHKYKFLIFFAIMQYHAFGNEQDLEYICALLFETQSAWQWQSFVQYLIPNLRLSREILPYMSALPETQALASKILDIKSKYKRIRAASDFPPHLAPLKKFTAYDVARQLKKKERSEVLRFLSDCLWYAPVAKNEEESVAIRAQKQKIFTLVMQFDASLILEFIFKTKFLIGWEDFMRSFVLTFQFQNILPLLAPKASDPLWNRIFSLACYTLSQHMDLAFHRDFIQTMREGSQDAKGDMSQALKAHVRLFTLSFFNPQANLAYQTLDKLILENKKRNAKSSE